MLSVATGRAIMAIVGGLRRARFLVLVSSWRNIAVIGGAFPPIVAIAAIARRLAGRSVGRTAVMDVGPLVAARDQPGDDAHFDRGPAAVVRPRSVPDVVAVDPVVVIHVVDGIAVIAHDPNVELDDDERRPLREHRGSVDFFRVGAGLREPAGYQGGRAERQGANDQLTTHGISATTPSCGSARSMPMPLGGVGSPLTRAPAPSKRSLTARNLQQLRTT